MAYTDTWDADFEASPADSDNTSEGAERIRDTRIGIRERLEKDHYMDIAGTDVDHGEHKWVTLREQASAPGNVADKGFLYIKDVGSGVEELFYEDEAGNEIQLTSGNYVAAPFASGTKMWFFQNTAPTGWTIDSTPADSLLAVKGGSGAFNVNGGTKAGTWTQDHIHTYNTVIAHTHNAVPWGGDSWGGAVSAPNLCVSYAGNVAARTGYTTSSTGEASGNTSAPTSATWRPLSQVGIICTKD